MNDLDAIEARAALLSAGLTAHARADLADLVAEVRRLRRRTHEIQAEESRWHADRQRKLADAEAMIVGYKQVCREWYEKSKVWAAERDELRTLIAPLLDNPIPAMIERCLWCEKRLDGGKGEWAHDADCPTLDKDHFLGRS